MENKVPNISTKHGAKNKNRFKIINLEIVEM
jgi:hypothetical protein